METKHDFTQGNILKKLVLFMVPIFGALVLQAMYGAVDLIIVGWFGTTAGISAVSTGSNLVNLVVFTVTGLSLGITVLISRYIGEKKQERIGKVIGGVIWFFAILAVILTIALLLAAPVLAKLMQAPEAVLTSFLFSYMGYFNGKGKTLFVMAQGLAQTFLVRIPMSYFMSIQPDASLTKIGLAAPTATVFGIILCSFLSCCIVWKSMISFSLTGYCCATRTSFRIFIRN